MPPPAYLLSLELEGAFSFPDGSKLDLTNGNGLPARWTLILGDNGTGKTTLLRCLAAMEPRAVRHKVLLPRIFWETSASAWFGNPKLRKQGFYLKLRFMFGAALNKLKPANRDVGEFRYQVPDDQNEIVGGLASTYDPSSIRGLAYVSQNIDNARNRAEGLTLYGYGATRRMGSTSLAETVSEDRAASLFDEDVPLINAEEWLLQADYAAARSATKREAQKRERRFDRMREVLGSVLPDVEEIRITPAKGNRALPSVEFLTPAGWVPLAGLGLGYRTVVAWMVDLAARMFDRYPDSKDPLAEPAIVLVDEIDLHLHPKWQRLIMSHLSERLPNTQFIATAHSPLVVQAAKDANLVLLRREDDKVMIDNDPAVIENWRVDQILTSVFDLPSSRPPEIEPLLAERRAILSKPRLTAADKRKLSQLEEKIGALPTAENPADIVAMDIIRRAAAILEGK